jgi:sec-independent protein translocase protein TatB
MFDISLFEMVVIGVVALIVIGPERLPGVARTAGHLFGRMQRYVNEVKSDIQREIELDELKKLRESVEESAREIEHSVSREFDRADQEMRELQELIDPESSRRSGSAANAVEARTAESPMSVDRPQPDANAVDADRQPSDAASLGKSEAPAEAPKGA